jgi:hypothetical protein
MVMVISHSSLRWHMLRYDRDHHFAAVASDNTSVELRPTMASWNIHDYLLAMWGTPVGELFDLEALSQLCHKLGRYSFFVTSAPLNVLGGIACIMSTVYKLISAPPNCLAIF